MENTENGEKPKRPERVRRTKSGPQIYGQDSTGGFEDSQGVIRKDIPARSSESKEQDIEMTYEPVEPNEEASEASAAQAEESAQAAPAEEKPQRPARTQEAPQSKREARREEKAQAKQAAQEAKQESQEAKQAAQETRQSAQAQPGEQAQEGISPDGMAQAVPVKESGRERPARTEKQEAPAQKQEVRKPKERGQKKSGKVTRLIEASRRALRSPLLIVVAIFQTVYLVAGIAAVFARELSYGQFAKLIASAGTPDQLSGYMDIFQDAMHALDTGAVWAALAIRLPDLLLCIGLWVLIVTVRRAKERMSGIGYFFFRLYVVLHMIVACILLLAALVLSVTLVIASWSAGTLMALAIAVLVAAIIVTMVIIMYYFCYLGTVKALQMNASRGDFYGRVSIFVGVIQIICGLTGIISVLSGIVNGEITGILTGAGRIGWMVLFGIWIFCYRRVMKPYEE